MKNRLNEGENDNPCSFHGQILFLYSTRLLKSVTIISVSILLTRRLEFQRRPVSLYKRFNSERVDSGDEIFLQVQDLIPGLGGFLKSQIAGLLEHQGLKPGNFLYYLGRVAELKVGISASGF